MNKWKPVDFVIGIFAITVAIILLSVILDSMITETTLTEEGAERYTALLGSLVAIISMYVGAKIQENRDNNDK